MTIIYFLLDIFKYEILQGCCCSLLLNVGVKIDLDSNNVILFGNGELVGKGYISPAGSLA